MNRAEQVVLRRRKGILVVGFWLIVIAVWFAVTFQHHLGSDYSPDGHFRADYSYSCRDPLQWLVMPEANPILHLKVTDLRSDKTVLSKEYLGDVSTLREARERFALPWESSEQ
jgi:hypothetical protein